MYLNYRELDADIIIIGSGITGLSAAFYLIEKDPHMDFLVLDVDEKKSLSMRDENTSLWNTKWASNPRLKMRRTTFADDLFGNVEGGQFICGKQEQLVKLLNKLDISLIQHGNKCGNVLVDYDQIYEVSEKRKILDFLPLKDRMKLKYLCSQIDDLSTKVSLEDPRKNTDMLDYDKISMEIFLDKIIDVKTLKDIITQTFLLNCGLQPRDVSALFFLAYTNSTQGIENQFHKNPYGLHQFHIDGGADNIKSKIRDMIGEDSIVKVSEISEISWDDTSAGIKTPNEYFFANKVIYTLSEAETNNISFVPPLSDEKRTISNNFVRGTLKKFKVTYEKPFWTETNLSGDVYIMNTESRRGPIQICLNISEIEERKYILTGLAEQDCETNEILNQLAGYFGEDALYPKTYTENRSSLLELSFPQACVSMNSFQNIREFNERIIWASPETTKNWYGTVAGSVEAGFDGALRVLLDVKPNILSFQELQEVSPFEVVIPPRRLGVFGYKWHIFVPTVLITLFVIVKLKKYLTKKVVPIG